MPSTRKKGTGSARAGGSARSGGGTRRTKSPKRGNGGATARRAVTAQPRSTGTVTKASTAAHGEYSQLGLLEVVQRRFLNDVFDQAQAKHSGWKILIVDKPSMKVISAVIGMYDIMERKVSLVESLDKKRAPFKEMAAIYILSPCKKSVEKLVKDYEDKSKLLYGDAAFVFFLGPIPSQLLDMLMKCKQLTKRLKSLSEINVDFLVKEDRAYQLEISSPFRDFYTRKSSARRAEAKIASKLVTLCASLNEYPYIRYNQSSRVCSSLALTFKSEMDGFVGANPNWWYHGSGGSGKQSTELERSTILLLDRSSDCLTPLMHDFTYQPMVQDLLALEGAKITVDVEGADDPDESNKKDVLLNDKDKLWVELRSKHIAQVIEILSSRISETVNSGSGNALSGSGKDVSLSQLSAALKALPEYRQVISKLSQHMHISRECMDKFSKHSLYELSELEQLLATGEDDEGDKIDPGDLVDAVEQKLIRLKDSKSRLRLLMIAILCLDGLEKDRLTRAAKLNRDEILTVENLSRIGGSSFKISKKKKNKKGGFFSKLKSDEVSDDEDSAYQMSRYNPMLKDILNEMVANTLSLDEYPSVVPMPPSATSSAGGAKTGRSAREKTSVRKKNRATDKWNSIGGPKKAGAQSIAFSGSRNLVFMVGGISYSELRVARKVMEKESREIIIGSTQFINAKGFISCLDSLSM